MNEIVIPLIYDKEREPQGCDHMTTFMSYAPGEAGYSIACKACGYVVGGGMAGHN